MTNPATPARAEIEHPEVVDPRPASARRVHRTAGQGHARRHDDEATARRGARPRRSTSRAASACARSTRHRCASSARRSLPICATNSLACRCPSPRSWGAPPTTAELQIAQAQLVGWLEGLIQGHPSHVVRAADGRAATARQHARSNRPRRPSRRRPADPANARHDVRAEARCPARTSRGRASVRRRCRRGRGSLPWLGAAVPASIASSSSRSRARPRPRSRA